MGVQTFNDNGPHLLLWAVSRAAGAKVTASGVPNRLIYCVIFILWTHFTNVAAGRVIQPGCLQFGDPWSKRNSVAYFYNKFQRFVNPKIAFLPLHFLQTLF